MSSVETLPSSRRISESGKSADGKRLLQFDDVYVSYGPLDVLTGVNLEVFSGEIVCLLGGNAAGKSTTMKAVLGLVRARQGHIRILGDDIARLSTSDIVRLGVGVVPEARRLFHRMSVLENIMMGAYTRAITPEVETDLERVFELFPRLAERSKQLAGTLSGGEQQMVAFGRALMMRPKLLIMDEPSMGLAPNFVEMTFEVIQQLNRLGTTMFLVEQNAHMALSIADRGYVLALGKIAVTGPAADLRRNELVQRAYLGG